MKYYDQLDVIPIFMTSLLMFNIIEGMILLDEISLYSSNQLLGIAAGIVACIIGIIIIMTKNADKIKT